MVKFVKTGLAALIAATSIAASAAPADAAGYYGHGGYGGYGGYGYRHDHDDAAPWIIGGILGLGLIAAVAASSHADHPPAAPVDAYQGPDGGAPNHPDVCTQQRQVWDPNAGQYVTHNYRVAC